MDTTTNEISTLSLHDALPIYDSQVWWSSLSAPGVSQGRSRSTRLASRSNRPWLTPGRSEEHTSELQSRRDLVCRLLLEKKKRNPVLTRKNTWKQLNRNQNTGS